MKRKNAEVSLVDRPFGRLIVISKWEKGGHSKGSKWMCLCDCGEYVIVAKGNLINRHIKSCGCFRREIKTTHGQAKHFSTTSTYKVWQYMKDRCNNQNNSRYKDYGGRGITVCERWMRFENFFEDMGERPSRLSIERKNNDLGYFKENCKWATDTEQARNTRSNRMIEYNGERKCLAEWSNLLGINYGTLHCRLEKHSPQIAFNSNKLWRI